MIGSVKIIAKTQAIPAGSVKLRIRGFPKYYRFSYSISDQEFTELGGIETTYLEGEDGLKSVKIEPFASGNGIESTSQADFDWFDYNPNPTDPYADLATTDPALPTGYTIFSVAGAEKGIIQKYPFITKLLARRSSLLANLD